MKLRGTYNKYKKAIFIIILIATFLNLLYTYNQYLGQTLDGDMAWNLIPNPDVIPTLESPLGLTAIKYDSCYSNPNRFFCHWIYREYLLNTPLKLQDNYTPINSVYIACAMSKMAVQLLLLAVMTFLITGSTKVFSLKNLLVANLLLPFFQVIGYREMTIIDASTTFVFFYALPSFFLLLYLLPLVYREYFNKTKHLKIIRVFWSIMAFLVCLSGPLNPGAILTLILVLFIPLLVYGYKQNTSTTVLSKLINSLREIPTDYWYCFIPLGVLSVYSLFLGTYNSLTIDNAIPVWDRYEKMFRYGIKSQFFSHLAFPLLFFILILNTQIIRKLFPTSEGLRLRKLMMGVFVFCIIYMLLLPLGGYRSYRPFVLRYDTILPITLALILAFGSTTLYLLKNLKPKHIRWYIPIILGILITFRIADLHTIEDNTCEKDALHKIASTSEKYLGVDNDCNILGWIRYYEPDYNYLNAQLLVKWKITDHEVHYFNNPL